MGKSEKSPERGKELNWAQRRRKEQTGQDLAARSRFADMISSTPVGIQSRAPEPSKPSAASLPAFDKDMLAKIAAEAAAAAANAPPEPAAAPEQAPAHEHLFSGNSTPGTQAINTRQNSPVHDRAVHRKGDSESKAALPSKDGKDGGKKIAILMMSESERRWIAEHPQDADADADDADDGAENDCEHKMVVRDAVVAFPASNGEWFCDVCGEQDPEILHQCKVCNAFDLCLACVESEGYVIEPAEKPKRHRSRSRQAVRRSRSRSRDRRNEKNATSSSRRRSSLSRSRGERSQWKSRGRSPRAGVSGSGRSGFASKQRNH